MISKLVSGDELINNAKVLWFFFVLLEVGCSRALRMIDCQHFGIKGLIPRALKDDRLSKLRY